MLISSRNIPFFSAAALYLERAEDMKMKSSWAQRIVAEGAQQLHDLIAA